MSDRIASHIGAPFKADGNYSPAYVSGPNGFRFLCYNAVELARQLNEMFVPSEKERIGGEAAPSPRPACDQCDPSFGCFGGAQVCFEKPLYPAPVAPPLDAEAVTWALGKLEAFGLQTKTENALMMDRLKMMLLDSRGYVRGDSWEAKYRWLLHNGGLLNEFAAQWRPAHGTLMAYIEAEVEKAFKESRCISTPKSDPTKERPDLDQTDGGQAEWS